MYIERIVSLVLILAGEGKEENWGRLGIRLDKCKGIIQVSQRVEERILRIKES